MVGSPTKPFRLLTPASDELPSVGYGLLPVVRFYQVGTASFESGESTT